MAVGPSGGFMKSVFNPAMMIKKQKAALQAAPPGGPGMGGSPSANAFGRMAKGAGAVGMKLLNAPKNPASKRPGFGPRLRKQQPEKQMRTAADRVLGAGPRGTRTL